MKKSTTLFLLCWWLLWLLSCLIVVKNAEAQRTPFFFSTVNKVTDTNGQGQQAFWVLGNSTSGAGTNGNTGVGPTPSNGTAYYHRRSNNTIIEIDGNDLEFAADPPSNGSQWPQFAITYNSESGYKPVIVPCGVQSATFAPDGVDSNDWSTTGDNYALALADINSVCTQLGVTRPKAVFIAEGINDANGSVDLATINTHIISLVDRIRERFGDVDIVFTQIGSTAALTNARIATIRYYIREICRTDANCHMIGGMINLKTAGLYTDDFHLNQTGQNAIGNMYARWMKNSSYPKWARMIISSHVDELSTNRKNLIAGIDDHLTDYFNHDCLFFFKQTTANNAWLDWTFNTILNNSFVAVTFTANTAISTNGSNQYCRPGFVPSFTNLISSQNDVFMSVKFGTVTTAAGTSATAFGGLNAGTIGFILLQTNTNVVRYRANDVTNTDYSGHTKLQNDTEYVVGRTGTTKALLVNGTSVHSATVSSTGDFDVSGNLGSNNGNGTPSSFLNASYVWYRAGSYTGVDHSAFYAFLENISDHWND